MNFVLKKKPWIFAAGLTIATSVGMHSVHQTAGAQTPPEPGAPAFVLTRNISENESKFASVFPQVEVNPTDSNMLAVAWRRYSLPIDTNAPKGARTAECHVAVSVDGGLTFNDTNLMPYLRRERISAAEPELWYCNAPWVAFGPDGTIYAGGSLFTAHGDFGPEPKQGRARLAVSTDGGETWSEGAHGISMDKLALGLAGLGGGTDPEHTPWDGANGFADSQTGTFYSTAGSWVVASDDRGQTFGTVHQIGAQGWTVQRHGTFTASSGVLGAAFIASETPSPEHNCPCLAFATSTDKGRTFTVHLVAQTGEFEHQGTIRYPVAAADRGREGRFAITAYTEGHESVKVYYTEDFGRTWSSAQVQPVPRDVRVERMNQVGVGYTADGQILMAWRGFRRQGAFNTLAALLGPNGQFGPTIKVTQEPSVYHPLTYLGNYGNGNGGGDFTTWITGNSEYAFVAYPYSPRGEVLNTYFARIPLNEMR